MGIKNPFKTWSKQEVHFTSWLLKDVFWCLKLPLFATLMVIPTTFLTLYILFKEQDNRDTNLILSSWVFMNIFWMLHELQNFPYWPVQVCMILGGLAVVNSLYKKNPK
jgi:hypothetical protein